MNMITIALHALRLRYVSKIMQNYVFLNYSFK